MLDALPHRLRPLWLGLLLVTLPPSGAAAQDGPDACGRVLRFGSLSGPLADYARLAELTGAASRPSTLFRRASTASSLPLCPEHGRPLPWSSLERAPRPFSTGGVELEPLPLVSRTRHNSSYPDDRNNGALWAGRGLSTALSGGVRASWGPITAAIEPTVAYQRNGDFKTVALLVPGHDPLLQTGHPAQIDWPQRMGEDDFWTLEPGQSYLRVDWRGAAAGLSTENLWWGPTKRAPLLLGNTAGGFPHAFVRTARPADARVALVEAEVFWGRLSESDYFDSDPGNDRRLMGGLGIGIRPRGAEGLELGVGRLHTRTIPLGGLSTGDYLFQPFRPRDEDVSTSLTALMGRWDLQESGFSIYAEAVLGDIRWGEPADERDRAAAYAFGVEKVVLRGSQPWLRLYGELTHLQAVVSPRNDSLTQTYYVSEVVRQGHTHRGQMLGAWSGPGSETQEIGADVLDRWGSVGAFVRRTGFDDDAYFERYGRIYGVLGHDTEVTAGVRHVLALGQVVIGGSAAYSRRRNRDFLEFQTDPTRPRVLSLEENVALELFVGWDPGPLTDWVSQR